VLSAQRVQEIIGRAIEHATKLGIAVTVVVVDDGGYPLGLTRMDGAIKLSPEIALSKAYTAAMFRRPTADLSQMSSEFWAAARGLGLETVAPLPGGLPIREGDTLVGAIGVSGSAPSQDLECATAGLEG